MGTVRYVRVPTALLVDPVRIRVRPLDRSVQVEIHEDLVDPLLTDGLTDASRGLADHFEWRTRPAARPPLLFQLRAVPEMPDHRLVTVDMNTPGRIDVGVPAKMIAAELVPHLEAHIRQAMRFLRLPLETRVHHVAYSFRKA